MKGHVERLLSYKSELTKSGVKRRTDRFVRRLNTPSDKVEFDDKVLKVLFQYEKTEKRGFVDSVRHHCNRVDFAQSRKDPQQLNVAIDKLKAEHAPNLYWNPHYRRAISTLKKYFKQMKLDMLEYSCDEDIIDAIPKTSTHAGFTFLETGKRTKGENLEDIYRRYRAAEAEARKNGTMMKPILPGVRTQNSPPFDDEGKPKPEDQIARTKTRFINMVDMFFIIMELRFWKPLQRAFSTQVSWYGMGKPPREMRHYIGSMRRRYTYFISLDYSAYDQSIPGWLISDAFSVLKSAFRENTFDPVLWDVMVHDYIHKDILGLDGKIFPVSNGMGSGMMGTSGIDSVVNMLMTLTYMYSRGIKKFECSITGDDNLIYTKTKIDKKDICNYLTNSFGIIVNEAKTSEGKFPDYPTYLSRTCKEEGEWRQPAHLVTKLLFPESFRDYSKPGVSPELVVLGYCLTYPLGMKEFLDVRRLLNDHCPKMKDIDNKALNYLPGSVRATLLFEDPAGEVISEFMKLESIV